MKLKICGVKHLGNAGEIARLQPDYMGFIFYEKSPRHITRPIPIPNINIHKVGVFVNATVKDILSKIDAYNLQAVQLHGNESPEFCLSLKKETPAILIKVFSIADHFDFDLLKPYEAVCDFYLFDTKGKLPGGNGYTFNWEVLHAYPSRKPFFLSGGIGLEQIPAIRDFLKSPAAKYCHALDINSRFELTPGLKDIQKLTEFKLAL